MFFRCIFFVSLMVSGWGSVAAQQRAVHSLDGSWQLQVDGQDDWQTVQVPGTFEDQISIGFDGVATFRKQVDAIPIGKHQRLHLRFHAVATKATVWLNGERVGEHLGGWTPFQFDVTELARSKPEGPWEIEVQADELVGHNTQGFLPIIAPHFGGIWQSVQFIETPSIWILKDQIQVHPHLPSQSIRVHVPTQSSNEWASRLEVFIRPRGHKDWQKIDADGARQSPQPVFELKIDCRDTKLPGGIRAWSDQDPAMYDLLLHMTSVPKDRLGSNDGLSTVDQVIVPFAFREIQILGGGFLLNGKPINFRGMLNWGYAPPRTAPSLDEEFMRAEIAMAKQRGFNMMKFCLWVPPKRYLELCDEMGMMAWIEYPTWHPDFSEKHLRDLKKEYGEFFAYDGNHPSVVLRSLTCETGPSAELAVIQSLYDQCKARIPGAIVVDDSSWIAWNRVFDFYDDHPYGNNHTWVDELSKLKAFIAERAAKPLMLGEAITADTWTPPSWFDPKATSDDHWQPNFLEPSRTWLADAEKRYGSEATDQLVRDSKKYAMLMRKYQMETFRREVPDGGYVVSVIRDMPKAAMGIIDYRGKNKWSEDDWNWHGDKMLLLKTDDDSRSFLGGSRFTAELLGVGFEGNGISGVPNVTLTSEDGLSPPTSIQTNEETERPSFRIEFQLPRVTKPTRMILRAVASDGEERRQAENEWPIWVLPTIDPPRPLIVHPSAASSIKDIIGLGKLLRWESANREKATVKSVVVTTELDDGILEWLESGGKVILLCNDQPGSLPLQNHWFLRGGPVVSQACAAMIPRDMLIELQHFDLADRVIRDVSYLDDVDPLLMLWEAHDLDHIKTNGLLFHMPVGQSGNLVVSALQHGGQANAIGSYLLKKITAEVAEGKIAQWNDAVRGPENLKRLRKELNQWKIMLDKVDWKFKSDPDEKGKSEKWFARELDDADWATIKTDRHWESQGHDQLDNWAWYRLDVAIPADWDSKDTYLNFTGVDDYYDLYVNGERIGSGGDIEKRETAFELRASHDITKHVKAGQTLQISVAVYDWYGAGGIFRPVWISSQPLSDEPRILK